ncbi:PREDICTED: probable BOI-related E3 ubiquitin-protein ligase 2 [Nelumbo nucifera]|uniref:Probable BOI-related E3 ubiquitin-protein ligase 2 n=1 Tax=Nelumbo nucifera TaxID=4432 RepID=A0A1U7YMA7_NELNU|nr:PREDICTED: probable BOI-related E3 ubiquitin-protein ligase 2 [Nelumbo nucifera]
MGHEVTSRCGVGPMSHMDNEHAFLMNRPTKQGREAEDVPRQQRLQISLNTNFCQYEAHQLPSIPKMNPVPTRLRLSYNDDEHNSSVTSINGSMTETLPVILSLGDNLRTEIDRQKEEFDHYIRVQEEHIIKGVREMKQRHMASFLSAIGKGVGRKLHEKELEIENMNRKNKELVERIKQMAMEVQSWQYQAKYNESVISVLKSNLKQAIAQYIDQGKEGCGDNEVEDAESSCINQNNHLIIPSGSENGQLKLKERVTCIACKGKVVSMLLLPCRHLCLCMDCDGFIHVCPICQLMKTASIQVYIS